MKMKNPKTLPIAILICFGSCFITSGAMAAAEQIAPPGADETLIYVMREARLMGGGLGVWIAVNDQTVARVKHKKHAVIRAKAGLITLNLALRGQVQASIALDDRPGETVYLRWRLGDVVLVEMDDAEARKQLRKSKLIDPIDAPRSNNEMIAALVNLSMLGFDLTHPITPRLAPDDNHGVITIFRRHDGAEYDLGIWSEHGFVGTLKVEEALEIRVPAGDHFFLAGNVGTSLLKAHVEAGKRYFAWLDFGANIGRVRLTPITLEKSEDLHKWLENVNWVELNADAITPRIAERVAIVTELVQSAAKRANTGKADFHLLSSEHAY